jgi:diguanylate cyclase (GGDEF)-like protein/PAS domain S-box-containing protein
VLARTSLLAWDEDIDPRLRAAVDGMAAGGSRPTAVLDASLRFVALTAEIAEFIGVPAERLLGVDLSQVDSVGCDVDGRLLEPADHPAAVALRTGEPVLEAVIGFEPRSDTVMPFRWFRMDIWPVLADDDTPLGVVGHIDDITGGPEAALATSQVVRQYRQTLRETRESEARFRALAENAADVVYQTDLHSRLVWASPSITEHLGWPAESLVGRLMTELVNPDDLGKAQARRAEALRRGADAGRVELRYLTASGEWRWMAALSRPMRDADGRITGGLTALRDVHSDVELRSELEYLAAHDGLTGLLNRTAAEQTLARELFIARGSDRWVGVLYLDLDGFKEVNDLHGHAAGDRVLIELSRQLVASLRETDTVARLGGDEFLVILPGMRDAADIEARAEMLLASLGSRHVPGVPRTTLTIGIAADRGHRDVQHVIASADAALLRAKEAGRDRAGW